MRKLNIIDNEDFEQVLSYFGKGGNPRFGVSILAPLLDNGNGITPAAIYGWKRIPLARAYEIERLTKKKFSVDFLLKIEI